MLVCVSLSVCVCRCRQNTLERQQIEHKHKISNTSDQNNINTTQTNGIAIFIKLIMCHWHFFFCVHSSPLRRFSFLFSILVSFSFSVSFAPNNQFSWKLVLRWKIKIFFYQMFAERRPIFHWAQTFLFGELINRKIIEKIQAFKLNLGTDSVSRKKHSIRIPTTAIVLGKLE